MTFLTKFAAILRYDMLAALLLVSTCSAAINIPTALDSPYYYYNTHMLPMPVLIDGPANAAGQAWCLIDAYRRENALLSLATSPAIDLHAKAVANLVVDPKFSGKIPDYIQQSVTDDLTERGFDSVYLASVKFHGNGENLYNAIHAEPVALQAISCASHAFIGLSVSQDYAVMIAATAQEEMNAPENFLYQNCPAILQSSS